MATAIDFYSGQFYGKDIFRELVKVMHLVSDNTNEILCPRCRRGTMTLVRTIPSTEGELGLLIFFCRECSHVLTKEADVKKGATKCPGWRLQIANRLRRVRLF
jgi:late competence protein required for DNA uptake (superfamily II DNA/RNA helicase)